MHGYVSRNILIPYLFIPTFTRQDATCAEISLGSLGCDFFHRGHCRLVLVVGTVTDIIPRLPCNLLFVEPRYILLISIKWYQT